MRPWRDATEYSNLMKTITDGFWGFNEAVA